MKREIVKSILGYILMIVGSLMFLPIVVSLIYKEPFRYILSFLLSASITIAIGFLLSRTKVESTKLYAREGFIIVSLSWILVSFFGALPFVFSQDIPSLTDAFFETASGFTTTGASILTDVEALSHSILFWRSFTHFIGGMGVLVFVLAILPKVESGSVHIMKAEMTGPSFGKLVSRLSSSARILYIIYFIFMIIMVILLKIAGLDWFHSLLLSFGTAGTGGFGVLNGSVAPYNNAAVEIILAVGMIVFGVNFNLFYMMVNKQVKRALNSDELKWYLGIIGLSIFLITLNLIFHSQEWLQSLRDSFFTVSSVITTTGYSTAAFDQWPLFSQLILLIIMFVGGMAGSTAGGLKVSRVMILLKSAWAEIKRTLEPNRVVITQADHKPIDNQLLSAVSNYGILYLIILIIAVLLVSLETPNFITAFSAVAATLNNIGPGLGIVGPSGSFAHFSPFIKVVLSFVMIIGRLEIFPVLILLSSSTWTKKIH